MIAKHQQELQLIKDLIKQVEQEKALQKPPVAIVLARLQLLAGQLLSLLQRLKPRDKQSVRRLVNQLIRGPKDLQKLACIIDDLDRAKFDLSQAIQLEHVRMALETHKIVAAGVIAASGKEGFGRKRVAQEGSVPGAVALVMRPKRANGK